MFAASFSHGPACDALMAVARDRSPVGELQCHALFGLFETCASLSHALKQELARHAHTESGFNVLGYVLHHASEVVTPRNIADGLGLSLQTVTAILGRLEVSGLIARERASEKKRDFTIKATAAGRQAFASALSHQLASITRLMSPLDPRDLAALDVTCARLREISTQLPTS
ncbi:MAG TPA: MarR family winged helix-turn-helix transcriptional regulator [Opitutus sp.]|nr:MarR family winged helix-turn-helix transcriptional regulator [Opitutus sp.]